MHPPGPCADPALADHRKHPIKREGLPAPFFGGILILVMLFPQNQRGLPMPVILFLALLEVTAYLAGETRFRAARCRAAGTGGGR